MIVREIYEVELNAVEMDYVKEVMKEYGAETNYSYDFDNDHYYLRASRDKFNDLYIALKSAYRDYSDVEDERTKMIRELYYQISLIVK